MTSSLGVQPNTGTVKNIWIFEARCACACVLFISIKNSKIPEHSARLIFGAGGGAQPGGLTLAVTTDRDCLGGVAAHPPTSANRPWRGCGGRAGTCRPGWGRSSHGYAGHGGRAGSARAAQRSGPSRAVASRGCGGRTGITDTVRATRRRQPGEMRRGRLQLAAIWGRDEDRI